MYYWFNKGEHMKHLILIIFLAGTAQAMVTANTEALTTTHESVKYLQEAKDFQSKSKEDQAQNFVDNSRDPDECWEGVFNNDSIDSSKKEELQDQCMDQVYDSETK